LNLSFIHLEFLCSAEHKSFFWSPLTSIAFFVHGSQWGPATVTDILQNIFFGVQQKKETHTEGEEIMIFGGNYHFKSEDVNLVP